MINRHDATAAPTRARCAAACFRAYERDNGGLSPVEFRARWDAGLRFSEMLGRVLGAIPLSAVEALGEGVRGDCESWTAWRTYPATTPDREIYADFSGAHYGGPGRAFRGDPWIQRRGSRALARVSGGLDI